MIITLVTASLLILSAPQIAPKPTARAEDEREIVTDEQREAVERGPGLPPFSGPGPCPGPPKNTDEIHMKYM